MRHTESLFHPCWDLKRIFIDLKILVDMNAWSLAAVVDLNIKLIGVSLTSISTVGQMGLIHFYHYTGLPTAIVSPSSGLRQIGFPPIREFSINVKIRCWPSCWHVLASISKVFGYQSHVRLQTKAFLHHITNWRSAQSFYWTPFLQHYQGLTWQTSFFWQVCIFCFICFSHPDPKYSNPCLFPSYK